jgi:hypothetical protein
VSLGGLAISCSVRSFKSESVLQKSVASRERGSIRGSVGQGAGESERRTARDWLFEGGGGFSKGNAVAMGFGEMRDGASHGHEASGRMRRRRHAYLAGRVAGYPYIVVYVVCGMAVWPAARFSC